MDNEEKLATQGTQDTRPRQTKQKHNITCVGDHYAQANTKTLKRYEPSHKQLETRRTEHNFYGEIIIDSTELRT